MDDKFKLNLGCGYNRLEGWLNLDVSAESAADRVMPAHDLDLPDRCAPAARAAQLVEHLGFFRTRFFLSECWRVLEPGAELTLETPDVEKSFRTFLEGGRQAREAALGWIFGAETPGMNHLYCFPRELLEELLAGAGFSGPVVEEFMFQPHRPAMRLTAKKLAGEGPALNAALRRRLLDEGVPLFRDEEESAGLESAITGLLRSSGPAERLELALVSAPAALACFSVLEENERHPSAEAAACAKLAQWLPQARQAASYLRALSAGAAHEAAFAAGIECGRGLLRLALAGGAPEGLAPADGAPSVYTPGALLSWAFRHRACAGLRDRG